MGAAGGLAASGPASMQDLIRIFRKSNPKLTPFVPECKGQGLTTKSLVKNRALS